MDDSLITTQLAGMVWVFGWLAFFLLLRHLSLKHQQKKLELIYKERQAAMEKGIPLPELPDYERPVKRPSRLAELHVNPRWPLGIGALAISLGVGSALALYLSGDAYHQQVWPFGLLGVFFGVGLFLHYWLTRPR